jgi:hypothetical protein
LGTGPYYFDAGTSGNVVISDMDDAGFVIADAIKFVPAVTDTIVVDEDAATFAGSGWNPLATGKAKAWNNDHRSTAAGDGDTATFTPTIIVAGNYNVYAWWADHDNRADNVPYTINYSDGAEGSDSDTVYVNQQQPGNKWIQLGTGPCFVIADAIKLETARPTEVIVDEDAATFAGSGWNPLGTGIEKAWNNDHRSTAAGDGDTATFTPNITGAGYYNVYAWWADHDNRADDVPYTINYSNGAGGSDSDTVYVNQQQPGNKWIQLGTGPYYFDAGTSGNVVISDMDDVGWVLADAIKFTIEASAAIQAPNVIGDNVDYGFYRTGHGANEIVGCLDCHDASKDHIDHIHRTYDQSNDYQNSYRLSGSLAVPRPHRTDIYGNLQDFALCIGCHNADEVLGENNQSDGSHTNFRNNDWNLHYYHIRFTSFDSAWDDRVDDSRTTCITCHNVHGSPTPAMTRHGEHISTYDTTDKVPGLGFGYVTNSSKPNIDPAATLEESIGSLMIPGGHSTTLNGMCAMGCHTKPFGLAGAEDLFRTPFLGPKVINGKADPEFALEGEVTGVTFTAFVLDHNSDPVDISVTIDVEPIGGGSTPQDMSHVGNGIWSYTTSVPGTVTAGLKTLAVTATDPDPGEDAHGEIMLDVVDPYLIIVDEDAATFAGSGWNPLGTGIAKAWNNDHRSTVAGDGDTATFTPNILVAGNYNVYAWWADHDNRADNVPYTINYSDGAEGSDSDIVYVNQQQPGHQWIQLGSGSYYFDAGTSGNVVISDMDDAGFVLADAIWLELQP